MKTCTICSRPMTRRKTYCYLCRKSMKKPRKGSNKLQISLLNSNQIEMMDSTNKISIDIFFEKDKIFLNKNGPSPWRADGLVFTEVTLSCFFYMPRGKFNTAALSWYDNEESTWRYGLQPAYCRMVIYAMDFATGIAEFNRLSFVDQIRIFRYNFLNVMALCFVYHDDLRAEKCFHRFFPYVENVLSIKFLFDLLDLSEKQILLLKAAILFSDNDKLNRDGQMTAEAAHEDYLKLVKLNYDPGYSRKQSCYLKSRIGELIRKIKDLAVKANRYLISLQQTNPPILYGELPYDLHIRSFDEANGETFDESFTSNEIAFGIV